MNELEKRWAVRLALVGVMAGAAVPLGGCYPPCAEFEPEGRYRIITLSDDPQSWGLSDRPDWVVGSGRMEVFETTIVFSYTTLDGSQWEVEYERTDAD